LHLSIFNKRRNTSFVQGFSLVELVIVIVVLGIISAVVLPRLLSTSDLKARGFQDETRALLRYAQKAAVAQRRNVCVTLSGTGVSLSIDNGGTCNGTLTLPSSPRGGTGMTNNLLPADLNTFYFQPLGDTNKAANITATIDGTVITVDFKTGYVY
jgi:MSHA pilin protein MshC